jgi:DNA-directed RNA polymerase subunit beta
MLNFDGASLDQINELTDEAGIPRFGHTYLYDGGTGGVFIKQQLLV